MAKKIIIDADPGIGDATAIATALMDPELEVMAITAVAGCVPGDVATRNVQAIIDWLDPPRLPRVGCADASPLPVMSEAANPNHPSALNGESGLGDCLLNVADLHQRHESAKLMADIVKTHPNQITIVTLGPLTNVAVAHERAPEFLEQVKELVCLGGSLAVGGDYTAAAEFNVGANPEAARDVLCSPATKTLIPLDVSQQLVLTFEQLDRLPKDESSRACDLLGKLLPFAFRAYHQKVGLEGMRLNELAAIALISCPRFFERESMMVDVETSGEMTRGMTVFDRRGLPHWLQNIDVLTEVDVQGVLDYLMQTIRRTVG